MNELTLKDKIEILHKKLNNQRDIDLSYYRRNKKAYEFVSYINHIIGCYYSDNYEVMTTFLIRSKKFLSDNRSKSICNEYRSITNEYLDLMQSFILSLKREDLIERIKIIT